MSWAGQGRTPRWVCPHDPYGTDRDTRTYCPQAVLADASRESGAGTHFFGDGCSPAHECPADHNNKLGADMCGTCGLVYVRTPRQRWGTCCPSDPECEHSFLETDALTRWMDTPLTEKEARDYI